MHNRDKTHCNNGHPFDVENTVTGSDGFRRCKICNRDWHKQYWHKRKTDPVVVKRRKARIYTTQRKLDLLWNMYRLRDRDYAKLLANQEGKCKACKESANMLQVDHDHSCCSGPKSCGKCVRGLLCGNCNKILGLANDSVKRLKDLIVYLNL
jgi:hypothetical protein